MEDPALVLIIHIKKNKFSFLKILLTWVSFVKMAEAELKNEELRKGHSFLYNFDLH